MARRRSQKAVELENKITEALAGIRSGRFKSAYAAGKALGIRPDTVNRRVQGGNSRQEARQKQQLLTTAQQRTLLKWIKQLTISGYAPTHQLLREIAEEVRVNKVRVFDPFSHIQPATPVAPVSRLPLGQEWVKRFVKRHNVLRSQFGRRVESARLSCATEPIMNAWFDAFKDIVSRFDIAEENIYNMDKTGFCIGTMESTRIIVDSSRRTRYQAQSGRQEWVSILECVCADGSSITPFVIFKGTTNVLQNWIPPEILHKWFFAVNAKGWTSNVHGVEWLKRVFEPITRAKAAGRRRLLICDGHDSHISGNFISHCIQNLISILILPPHTSHLLQPLDVSVFGPLKKRLTAALSYLNEAQLQRIKKAEWLEAYVRARQEAITESNVHSAWRGAGLAPFSPHRVIRIIRLEALETSLPEPHDQQRHEVYDNVFISSSPPHIPTLHRANEVLRDELEAMGLESPTARYIRKLADETERLSTQHIIQKRDTDNLCAILTRRRTRQSGKRAALAGHFHITDPGLLSQVQEAEEATASSSRRTSSRAIRVANPGTSVQADDEDDDWEDFEAIARRLAREME
jgi:hypothetical protein